MNIDRVASFIAVSLCNVCAVAVFLILSPFFLLRAVATRARATATRIFRLA